MKISIQVSQLLSLDVVIIIRVYLTCIALQKPITVHLFDREARSQKKKRLFAAKRLLFWDSKGKIQRSEGGMSYTP